VVAYARSADPGAKGREKIEVLAKFGNSLPDGSSVWAIGESRPLASSRGNSPQAPSLRARLRAGRNAHFIWKDVVIPRALAVLFVAALGASAGSLAALAGKAHRLVRLVEIARPACLHVALENKDLHRIVRHELRTGSSTKYVVSAVTSLCQAISRES
jgi:hypothetical protein